MPRKSGAKFAPRRSWNRVQQEDKDDVTLRERRREVGARRYVDSTSSIRLWWTTHVQLNIQPTGAERRIAAANRRSSGKTPCLPQLSTTSGRRAGKDWGDRGCVFSLSTHVGDSGRFANTAGIIKLLLGPVWYNRRFRFVTIPAKSPLL